MSGSFVRRHVVSLVIVAVTMGLGGYLWLVDRGRVTTGEEEARKRNLLKSFRRAEISELVIEHKGESIRISQRADDAGEAMYYLDDGELADQTAVDKLLGALEFATAERSLDEGVDRRAMGLDAPSTRLTLSMGSLVWRLSIGGPAPAPPGSAYGDAQGAVVVVGRDLVTELARPRDAYRSKTLVPYLSSSLAEMKIEGSDGARRFVASPGQGWSVVTEGDAKVRVDRDAFDRVLTALADLRAETFLPEADAARVLGAAPDKLRLTMTPSGAGRPRAILDLGGECPGQPDQVVVLRVEPGPKKAACAPKVVMAPLATPLARMIDLRLFSARPDEMEEISLEAEGKKLEMARSGPGWHMRAPTEGNVETDAGQGFARALYDLVAERVASAKPAESLGFGTPRSTSKIVKVGAGEETAPETVEIGGDASNGLVYARRLADGAVLEVSRDVARALVPNSFALRSRKVIDVPTRSVSRVAIDGPSVRQVLRRSPIGVFTLEEPKGLAPDPGLANDVVDALADMKAERWVADRDDGSFGLSSPRGTYELDLEGGALRVETGRDTSGGVFARRTDQPGVFVLPAATERTLEIWAVDRSYFMVDSAEVRRIRLDRGADSIVLDGQGGRDAAASNERFEIARRALAEARAEGLVHPGAPRKEEGLDKPLLFVTVDRVAKTPGSGEALPPIKFSIGRGDVWRDTSVFYARRDGVDATFAIAQSKLRPLLDLH